MIHLVIDNFFDNIDEVYNASKQVEYYNLESFNKEVKPHAPQTWPGKRSKQIHEEIDKDKNFKLIHESFINALQKHSIFSLFPNNDLFKSVYPVLANYLHLRTEDANSDDWIHRDNKTGVYTMLVFLSPTNLTSGTKFYAAYEDEMVTDVKFVQNRALLFNGAYRHMGYGHHGNNIEDGRITLNSFINFKKDGKNIKPSDFRR